MRHIHRPGRALLVLLCLTGFAALAFPPSLSAQSASTGGLRGRVLDQDSVPVEGALVTLVHTRTGAASTALSVADGRYTLRGQRPGGPYTVTVTRIGFRELNREGIELLLGRFVDLNITLVSEAIEVAPLVVEVEPDPVFNPGRIGISTLVTAEVLRELPTLTRNFLDFAALSPLVRTSEEGISVAGANYRFNSLNIDGALNQDVFGLSTNNIAGGRAGARVIPLEAVEQFRVEVAPFDIRQSGFTGGALNAVTRSGTNEFETSAFGFYRNDALAGELVIDDVSTVPDLATARAGFTAGGPIRRDRAHFFVAGEWERVREPPTGFHVGESDPLRLSLVPDSVARMRSLLRGAGRRPRHRFLLLAGESAREPLRPLRLEAQRAPRRHGALQLLRGRRRPGSQPSPRRRLRALVGWQRDPLAQPLGGAAAGVVARQPALERVLGQHPVAQRP